MTLSRLAHTTRNGERLFAILSLDTLRGTTPEQLAALQTLGIHSIGDLLDYPPIHDAQLLVALADGVIGHDAQLTTLVVAGARNTPHVDLARLTIDQLARLTAAQATIWRRDLGVVTVEQFARFEPFVQAQRFLAQDVFEEEPSAPQELIPLAVGSVSNISRYSGFIRESAFDFAATPLALRVDQARLDVLDPRLLMLFQIEPQPTVQLGYTAHYRQFWVNLGTSLGEPLKSIGLAPGETRRIAILDWQRRASTKRTENTTENEDLDNLLVHNRAQDEVVRATAREHQNGGTSIDASTLATSVGGVAAGALAGAAAVGIPAALVGAALGLPEGGIGAAPGALIGLAVGSVVGGVGGAFLAASNQQLGVVQSDTQGTRQIASQMAQQINDIAQQKASSVRSLMSTVVVTEEQQESSRGETIAIANYNHAHALTVMYFEVLQHYRVQIELDAHRPLFFLPFKPISFDLPLVISYWHALRRGFADRQVVSNYDQLITGYQRAVDDQLPSADADLRRLSVLQISVRPRPFRPLRVNIQGNATVRAVQFAGDTTLVATFDPANLPTVVTVTGLTIVDVNRAALPVLPPGLSPDLNLEIAVEIGDADGRIWRIAFEEGMDTATGSVALHLLDQLNTLRAEQLRRGSALGQLADLVERINDRRYFFTRLLLLGMEPEQLTDLVDALVIGPVAAQPTGRRALATRAPLVPPAGQFAPFSGSPLAGQIRRTLTGVRRQDGLPLSVFIDPRPIGVSDDLIVFQMKHLHPAGQGALNAVLNADLFGAIENKTRDLVPLRDYPEQLAQGLSRIQVRLGDDIYLPTGGVFAEAILGRSISAERLDGSRNIFWHELPIPQMASDVGPVNVAVSQQPAPDATTTTPPATLTPATPVALPDSALAAGVLAALNNGTLFRDQSKTDQLVSVLGNLSTLAGNMAQQAGTLAGQAQQNALNQASTLASKVADLSAQLLGQNATLAGRSPQTQTEKGVAANRVEDTTRTPPASPTLTPAQRAVARTQGVDIAPAPAPGTGAVPAGGAGAPASIPTEFIGGPQPAGGFPQRSDISTIPSAAGNPQRDQFDGISDPGQTAKAIIRDALQNAANGDGTIPDFTNVFTEWFDLGVRPALQAARNDDTRLDDAIRELLDWRSTVQQLGLQDSGEISRRKRESDLLVTDGLRNGVNASNQRLAGGEVRELQRIDRLLAISTSGIGVDSGDNLGLGASLANLAAHIAVTTQTVQPPVVAAGAAAAVTIAAGLVVGNATAVFAPPILVSITGFAADPADIAGQTDAQGNFTAQIRMPQHDPNALGQSRNDMRLAVALRLSTTNIVFTNFTLTAAGDYIVTALGALLDSDPTDRSPRASVHLGASEDALVSFTVAKGADFINGQPVTFTLQGAGTLNRTSNQTAGDGSGVVQVVYTAPSNGTGSAIITAAATDGVASGSANFTVDFG